MPLSSPPAPAVSAERVVLLDRDGTIVIDRDYLDDPAELAFLPGAADGLQRLHARGYRLVIVSNQSGVGRGLFTLERLREINARLEAMIGAAGAALAGIYCCPHRPDEGCACRKPKVELVRQAARELHFDPAAAVVIGDRDSDIELGRRIGATTIRLVPSIPSAAGVHPITLPADHRANDLMQAADIIEHLPPPARKPLP